jgi:hypothetical protein
MYPNSVIWAYVSRVGYDINNVDQSSDLDLTIRQRIWTKKYNIGSFKKKKYPVYNRLEINRVFII